MAGEQDSRGGGRKAWAWGRLGPAGAALLLAVGLGAAGCRTPVSTRVVDAGEREQRQAATTVGQPYAEPLDKRLLPDLAVTADLLSALAYAFNASGDVEAAYREWRAAIERIPQARSLPDPSLRFSVLFSNEFLKTFTVDALTLMAEQELPGVGKRDARGVAALAEARVAAERFRAAKFALQRRAVQAYADLALNADLASLQATTLRLLGRTREVALHRFHGMDGDSLADLRRIEVEIRTAESEGKSLAIMGTSRGAQLNGVIGRAADGPWAEVRLPAIRPVSGSGAELFARAVAQNSGLASLRREVEARGAVEVLAELEKRPDYSLGLGLEGLTPSLAAGLTLPVYRTRIRAGIAEALSMRQAAQARLRGATADLQARLVMALSGLADAERVLGDYRDGVLPQARGLLDTQLATYGSGGGDLLDVLDTQRLLVDFERLVAQAQADRIRYLAELEEILGEDLFQVLPAAAPGNGGPPP